MYYVPSILQPSPPAVPHLIGPDARRVQSRPLHFVPPIHRPSPVRSWCWTANFLFAAGILTHPPKGDPAAPEPWCSLLYTDNFPISTLHWGRLHELADNNMIVKKTNAEDALNQRETYSNKWNQHNWIIDIIEISKTFEIVMTIRSCWYTKYGQIDGYLKRRGKWLVR